MRKAIRKSLWVVMAMTGLAACNPQTAEIAALGSAQLGDNPTLTQGRYTAGGGLTVATELREMRGMTALCGVWSHSKKMPGLIKQVGPQVLSTAEVHVGGAVLFRGL